MFPWFTRCLNYEFSFLLWQGRISIGPIMKWHLKKAIIVVTSCQSDNPSIRIQLWPSCHVVSQGERERQTVYFWVDMSYLSDQTHGASRDVRKQVRVEEDLHSPVQLTSGKNKFGKQNNLRSRSSVEWNWNETEQQTFQCPVFLASPVVPRLIVKLFSDTMAAHRARLPLQIRRKLQTFVRYFVLFSLTVVVLIEGYR